MTTDEILADPEAVRLGVPWLHAATESGLVRLPDGAAVEFGEPADEHEESD